VEGNLTLSTSASEQMSDAATVVIEANGDPKSLPEYQHHILIFSQLPAQKKKFIRALLTLPKKVRYFL